MIQERNEKIKERIINRIIFLYQEIGELITEEEVQKEKEELSRLNIYELGLALSNMIDIVHNIDYITI